MGVGSVYYKKVAEYGTGIYVEIRTGNQNELSCLWTAQETEIKAMGLPRGLQTLACTEATAGHDCMEG